MMKVMMFIEASGNCTFLPFNLNSIALARSLALSSERTYCLKCLGIYAMVNGLE